MSRDADLADLIAAKKQEWMSQVRTAFESTEMAADSYEGVTHAGIALVNRELGVVLLAQRGFDESDAEDVRETWEFPGGHLEPGEHPLEGAYREFDEEIGIPLGSLEVVDGWRNNNGIYQGFVVETPRAISLHAWTPTDEVQAVAWVSPDEAKTMDLRPELADFDWSLVSGNKESVMDEDETDYSAICPMPIPVHGIVAPEEVETGDKRGFEAGSMTSRPLRLPFRYVDRDMGAHDGAVVVGSVDRLMRKDGMIHWDGLLMPTAKAGELVEVMEFFGGRYGVSVDGDKGSLNQDRTQETGTAWFESVRAAGLTAVDIPAFQEAHVAFGPHPDMPDEETPEFSVMVASGDLVGQQTFKRGPGWVTNPADTKRIHDYWMPGHPGGDKIVWGTPGDFRRAKALIGAKIAANSPEKARFLNQIIAQWHFDALGYWPGDLDKPGNKTTAEAKAERAAKVGAAAEHGIAPSEDGESAWEAVLVAAGVSGNPVRPPLEYFHKHPNTMGTAIDEPDENGFRRVYGYAAEWGVCHIGYQDRCVEPPRAFSDDYPDFHKGRTKVEGGGYVPTGVLTYNVAHRGAKQILTESATQAHFDNLKNAWAAVRLGEDDIGIWYSGVVLPKIPVEDIIKIEASGQVSGEWKYDSLRALLTVNVEGFAVERPDAEYDEQGNVVALAASAFGQMDTQCKDTPAERMAALRFIEDEIQAEARMAALRDTA